MVKETPAPTLAYEHRLWSEGYRRVAGLDEAGRGAWAGPVVAAAVVLPHQDRGLAWHLSGVRDSKLLRPERREALMDVIGERALALGVGAVPPAVIDAIGIVPATRRAMALALEAVTPAADYLLIDHLPLPDLPIPQEYMPHGDLNVLSIAAASIVAKVCRDRMMARLEGILPGYGFEHNKGYGTEQHQSALRAIGPTASHRFSFAPLQEFRVFLSG
ncbi:MAG: ribonuclease HII [Anaerolineae bacterium]